MDFAGYMCHNILHHQLAAGPCPAHNIAFQFDRQGRAVAAFSLFGVYGSLNKVVFPCLQLNFSFGTNKNIIKDST